VAVIKELVEPMEEELEIVKDELEEEKHEHVAAKKELATAKEQLAQQSKEMKALRKKLQESEAMHAQLESSRPGMVQTTTDAYGLGGHILFFLQHYQPSIFCSSPRLLDNYLQFVASNLIL
jgi:chromosome segregation ATPase